MNLGEERASGSIRISFGDEHGEREIDALLERIRMAVEQLKPLERSRR
jgi:cysteine desulfurase